MRVRVFAGLRALLGAKEAEVEVGVSDTVGDVLGKLTAEYSALGEHVLDEDGNLQSSVNVLLNGRSIRFLDGLSTTVQESDELALFPPVGGG